MAPDDIVGGGEIAIYRLIGRIVGGDTELPTIEELTDLDVAVLQTLVRLVRRALESDSSVEAKAAIKKFLRDRLDKAVRLKFAKTMETRAKELFRIRLPAFEALFRAKYNQDRLIGGGDAAKEARAEYDRHAEALGEGHVDMVEAQAVFALHQSDLSAEQVLLIIRAITLIEVSIDRQVAEAYFNVYSSAKLIEDTSLSGDGGSTKGRITSFGTTFLSGSFGLFRTAILLVHELVHVDQSGRKTLMGGPQMLEGRAYGIDWHMSVTLSDKDRIQATMDFMEGGLRSVVNEVADYCVTCVATHVLDRLRKELAVAGLPTTLHLAHEKAGTLYIELLTEVPKDYSVDLDAFLLKLSQEYNAGALVKNGWIRRIPRLAGYCTTKRFGSSLFESIAEGKFAVTPSE
jgi:hypothetical protein